ncbi:MAG: 3'-5' exonuclease [Oscillatoriales cyanobacterium C42_A2020_001]|nr:3'-5' exonuclease [Leptolyngbyaceae cyanobacterium C42_A2020_001]
MLIFPSAFGLNVVLSTELLAYYRRLSHETLTVVDVETTGYRPPLSRVIEISVLQASLENGVHYQQTHLVNPQVPIPPAITRFTGITQDMVNTAPLSVDIWRDYLPLVNAGILTAHNLAFDYSFLKSEFNYIDVPFSRAEDEQLCTVMLARLMLPDLPSRSLPNLVEHFGFDVGRSHRAAADTQACWLLAKHLLTEIQTEADDVLLTRFRQQWLTLKYAATLLNTTSKQAKTWLKNAKVEPRLVGRYQTLMYQRCEIERVHQELYKF